MGPFNMLIVGRIACGKTEYFLGMLQKDYKHHFDYIVLICTTFDFNKTYQEWKDINERDLICYKV